MNNITSGDDPNFDKFVNATSGLVNRGCPSIKDCPAGPVDGADKRLANAKSVVGIYKNDDTPFSQDDFETIILKLATPAPDHIIKHYTYESFMRAYNYVTTVDKESPFAFTKNIYNLSAFLGQCMQETLQFNACDENNWTETETKNLAHDMCKKQTTKDDCEKQKICNWDDNAKTCTQFIYSPNMPIYPSVTSCGQLGQYYKGYKRLYSNTM